MMNADDATYYRFAGGAPLPIAPCGDCATALVDTRTFALNGTATPSPPTEPIPPSQTGEPSQPAQASQPAQPTQTNQASQPSQAGEVTRVQVLNKDGATESSKTTQRIVIGNCDVHGSARVP